ncbi:hypothetical protein ACSBR2_041880 [Camellia fascicularis]
MVLALSYHDLPYQLKPCFLYFGHFPEDYRIDAERLYHLWIGDGIIVDDDRVGDETIMDVAKRYLGSLAQRCMVQVEVEEYTQRINYCRIHDLMLELCLSKAKMNDFLGIIHLQSDDLANCFSTTTSTTTAPKIRKLAIHLNGDVKRVVLPELETTKHLRSLLFCNSRSVNNVCSIELNSHLKYFKLLRNLHLDAFKFDEKSVESIGNLISLSRGFSPNLIELSLTRCKLEEDPMPTLERLPNLQYLYLGSDAFVGDKMVCSANGFPQLKTLHLFSHEYWEASEEEWEVEGKNTGR